ncbi:MAG: hypothetical protein WD969_03580 [Paracoccaceae bacterium]
MTPAERKERRRLRIVGLFKIGLPLFALGVFAALFVFNGARYDSRISFDGVDLSALDDGLRLTNPRFTGATKRGEPFTVAAAWALPDGPKPETIELSEVTGEINLADGRLVTIAAAGGMIRPKANHVALSGDVRLVTSDGYRLEAEHAALDAETEEMTASGGVMAEGPLGRITADRMRATRTPSPDTEGAPGGEDAYIWFENRVRVRVEQPNMAREPG